MLNNQIGVGFEEKDLKNKKLKKKEKVLKKIFILIKNKLKKVFKKNKSNKKFKKNKSKKVFKKNKSNKKFN